MENADDRPRLRVLYVIDSLARAGAEQSLVALAPHLLARQIDLHVAYLVQRDDLRPDLEAAGAVVHCLDGPGSGRRAWLRRSSALVADLGPDLVHTTIFESDLAGRLAAARHRVPCVSSLVNVTYGRTESAGLSPLRVRAAQAADSATGRLVTRWHALTRHVAQVMSRRLLIPSERVEVIPRGREPSTLGRRSPQRRAAVRARLEVGPDAPVVLAVGRQERQKGLDVLLNAMPAVAARHPGLVVLLAGRAGGESQRLRVLCRDLGLDDAVRVLGVRDDVADLLAGSDVLAFPSRWEGAGGTLLEAMALECPIVTTTHPALLEAVDRQSALLVPPDRPDELATAIMATLEHPEAAAERATAGRHRFESDFTVAASAARMADLYRRVAVSGRRRSRRQAAGAPRRAA